MNKKTSNKNRCKATQPKLEGAGRERCPMPAHSAQWNWQDKFCAGHQFNRYGRIATATEVR